MKKIDIFSIIILTLITISGCGGSDKSQATDNKLLNIAIWEDKRQADTLLYTYLSDDDPAIRARSCYVLGLLAPEGAAAYVADLLSDANDQVRLEAVFALGLLGDTLYSRKLAQLYSDPNSEIRRLAVIVTGKLGDSTAVFLLDSLAYDTIPEYRAWAAQGLWRAGAKDKIDLLGQLATDSVQEVEIAAIYALSRLAVKSSAGKLRFRLRDTIPEIRMFAARGLASMADSAALTDLSYALSIDKDWRVKASIMTAIQKIGSRKIVKALLNLITEKQHPLITEQGLIVLADLDIKFSVPKIKPHLQSKYKTVQGAAIVALARLEGAKFLPTIVSEIDNYDWLLKQKALEALSYIDNQQSIDLMLKMFEDEDHRVRNAALQNLDKIEYNEIEDIIAMALDDPDWGVNLNAVDIIAQKKLAIFYQNIEKLYKKALKDKHEDLRFGIAYSLSEWIDKDSQITEPFVLALMEKVLSDPDRNVRKLVIDTYEKIGLDKIDYLGIFETKIDAGTYEDYYGKYKTNPQARIMTTQGPITIELLYDQAPKTVVNFINLAESGYYNDVVFHRVVPNFVIQAGDPHGDGWGGPGYTIRCEYNRHEYTRGTVGMAHAGMDTGGSQFFICHSPQSYLNARYTAFGQVVKGLHLVDRILISDKIESIEIIYSDK